MRVALVFRDICLTCALAQIPRNHFDLQTDLSAELWQVIDRWRGRGQEVTNAIQQPVNQASFSWVVQWTDKTQYHRLDIVCGDDVDKWGIGLYPPPGHLLQLT